MIKITETVPRKVSGKTALHVTFNYNQELINVIKAISGPSIWLKDELCWELPLSSLSDLLDKLTFFDEIELKLLSTEIDQISDPNCLPLTAEEISNLGFKPYSHQIDGINYGLQKKKWLLLDNPGCGKTNQIIGLAETLKQRKLIDHCLIITGINSLKANWLKEIRKFSKQSAIIIGEKFKKDGTTCKTPATLKKRAEQLRNKITDFFVIINVESLRDNNIVKLISSGPNKFGMIAIDEVHKCLATGKSSQQGNNILKLTAEYQVAATGTLLLNNPLNCWGPLFWTENDHSTLTNFKNQYCTFSSNGFTQYQVTGYKNLDLLKDELDSCSLRRTKEALLDLPPKVINVELLEMSETQQKFYDAVKDGIKDEIDKVQLTPGNLLALTTRLRQATIDPNILTSEQIPSIKIDRCIELVEELMSSKEKVVILSTFKQPVYILAEKLAQYCPVICTGDQTDLEISNSIDKFQTDNTHMILIGTLAKCSTGLTLNRASYMIMLDEHWTSAMNTQAQDRIYRINNTTSAFITVLMCKDSIDERVHEVAQYKQDLSDFIIDNIPNETFADTLKEILFSL